MEPALKGDVAFIRAWKVDEVGLGTVIRDPRVRQKNPKVRNAEQIPAMAESERAIEEVE